MVHKVTSPRKLKEGEYFVLENTIGDKLSVLKLSSGIVITVTGVRGYKTPKTEGMTLTKKELKSLKKVI